MPSLLILAESSEIPIGCCTIVAIIIVIGIIGAIVNNSAAAAKVAKVRTRTDFAAADVYVSTLDQNGLAIERATSRLLIVRGNLQRIVPAEEIVSVEVMADDTSVVKSNRGSQVAGAAVGAVFFGPVGLLLGGLTGSKRSENRLKRLSLRIVTTDFKQPNHDILLYKSASRKGDTRDSILLKEPLRIAEMWHSRVTVLIRDGAVKLQSGPAASASFLTDQLRKWDELRREGILTDEEFDAQKRRLLDQQ